MAASKAARRLPGRPRRLPQEDLQRLRAELARPPSKLGFAQASSWSGKLLAQHLRDHYGVVLGTRQCRRILQTIETDRPDRPGPIARAQQSAAPVTAPEVNDRPNFARPNSDHANKEIALRRIKRICSSGLPLYPLARALFELIGDAIPHGANRVLLADDGHHPDRYVTSSSELARWTPVHKHFFIDSPPQVSGTIPVPSILRGGVVWTHEEIVLPHFYRSEGYNECMRHIGFHHALMINLRDHLELSGNYPLWRSVDMKPFNADDVRFAQAAAPYIAHALSVAARRASPPERSSKFAPLDDWGEGVIVMGRDRHVTAVDAMARAIFQELALFDGYTANFFDQQQVQTALGYIEQTLRSVFEDRTDPWTNPNSPAVQLYNHRIGLVLQLRGILVDGDSKIDQVVVLVKAGEHPEHRRRRIMYRYGLTPRLMDLLTLIGSGLSTADAAARMGLSKFTVNDYINRLIERLQLPDRTSLRRFAAELNSNS